MSQYFSTHLIFRGKCIFAAPNLWVILHHASAIYAVVEISSVIPRSLPCLQCYALPPIPLSLPFSVCVWGGGWGGGLAHPTPLDETFIEHNNYYYCVYFRWHLAMLRAKTLGLWWQNYKNQPLVFILWDVLCLEIKGKNGVLFTATITGIFFILLFIDPTVTEHVNEFLGRLDTGGMSCNPARRVRFYIV